MKYKLLVLDLDGTTVEPRPGALPSKRVAAAVKNAQARLEVTIATGRPLSSASHVIEVLELKGHGVINNGAQIYDLSTGEIIVSRKIKREILGELFHVCSPFGYEMRLYLESGKKVIKAQDDIIEDAEKFFVKAVDSSEALNMLEELDAVSGVAAHRTKSWAKGDVVDFHITHENATKRQGIEKLMEMLNLKKEEVIAIGDDHNDVPMMMAAGCRVAMGDAPKQVKELADYVTGTLEEDGVAQAIEKFILN